MRYGSVCSGVEAATVAWHGLGWQPEWFAEIEKFPSAVLAHHYPEVPNLGDMTTIRDHEKHGKENTIDLLVGGTPCQSFSIAGMRKGLDDDRGNLALEFCRLALATRPKWVVWENVPGVLSSNGGRDFGAILQGLGECGYGLAWRVLDAQYFGVPQRRRRVFLVGYLGDWRPATAILFERESLRRNPPPSREKRKEVTRGVEPSVAESFDFQRIGQYGSGDIGSTLAARDYKDARDLVVEPQVLKIRGGCEGGGKGALVGKDCSFTLATHQDQTLFCVEPRIHGQTVPTLNTMGGGQREPCICIQGSMIGRKDENGPTGDGLNDNISFIKEVDVSPTCAVNWRKGIGFQPMVHAPEMAVRRLTPVECERLQGFPDNYTRIPWRNKPAEDCPDGNRYKAMGNSMAVPVMRWIAERIEQVEEIIDD